MFFFLQYLIISLAGNSNNRYFSFIPLLYCCIQNTENMHRCCDEISEEKKSNTVYLKNKKTTKKDNSRLGR